MCGACPQPRRRRAAGIAADVARATHGRLTEPPHCRVGSTPPATAGCQCMLNSDVHVARMLGRISLAAAVTVFGPGPATAAAAAGAASAGGASARADPISSASSSTPCARSARAAGRSRWVGDMWVGACAEAAAAPRAAGGGVRDRNGWGTPRAQYAHCTLLGPVPLHAPITCVKPWLVRSGVCACAPCWAADIGPRTVAERGTLGHAEQVPSYACRSFDDLSELKQRHATPAGQCNSEIVPCAPGS